MTNQHPRTVQIWNAMMASDISFLNWNCAANLLGLYILDMALSCKSFYHMWEFIEIYWCVRDPASFRLWLQLLRHHGQLMHSRTLVNTGCIQTMNCLSPVEVGPRSATPSRTHLLTEDGSINFYDSPSNNFCWVYFSRLSPLRPGMTNVSKMIKLWIRIQQSLPTCPSQVDWFHWYLLHE